jgi:HSP20 family protein
MAKEKQRPERGVTLWQPFSEMDEMGRHFEDFFGRPFMPAIWRRTPSEGDIWAPALDVVEKDDKFTVKVELPGVREEDVDVSVSGDILTISGDKKAESETKKKGYYYSESSYGSFSRSITLPSTVDNNKIEASYDKGVLEISLPKAQIVKPKKIKLIGPKKKMKEEEKENSTG